MQVAKTIELEEHTERELRVLAKRRTVEARLQQRALVVLLAAEGRQNKDIAVEAGLDEPVMNFVCEAYHDRRSMYAEQGTE